MAEDTREFDDISDKGLEVLEANAPSSRAKESMDALERELFASREKPDNEKQMAAKGPDIDQNIDKMLEDTLSEFGLNISKKEMENSQDKKILHEKVDDLVEKIKEEKESESFEKEETSPGSPEGAEPPMPENGAVEAEPAKKEARHAEAGHEEKAETAEKRESLIFSEKYEDKERNSLFIRIKNSLGFLKKLPLKYLLPSILAATIAVSAPFYFRKPSPANRQNLQKAAQQTERTQEATPINRLPAESASKQDSPEKSPSAAEKEAQVKTKPEKSAKEARKGTVRTRVSEVFQIQSPAARKKPEINPIDHSKDIIEAEPAEDFVAPLLSGEETVLGLKETAAPDSRLDDDRPKQRADPEPEAASSTHEGPKTKAGDLVPISQVDIPPEIVERVEPEYPGLALKRRVGGQVVLNALISEDGDVIETALIRGIKGPYGFNEVCEKAARQWKFVPAFKDGVKVKVWKTISFNFKKS